MRPTRRTRPKMRAAVIVPLLLGVVSLSSLFVIGGSRIDEMKHKNTYFKARNLTDKTALAAANYYLAGDTKTDAADKALTLAANNPVYGDDLSAHLAFTWSDDTVTVTLPPFDSGTYWMRSFGVDSLHMPQISSSAQIYTNTGEETSACYTNTLKPLAINQQAISVGQTKTFRFRASTDWNATDAEGVYGLDLYAADPDKEGVDHVGLYLSELSLPQADFSAEGCLKVLCEAPVDFTISGDSVIPNEAYGLDVTVLGAALTMGAGGYDLMVTQKLRIGDAWYLGNNYNKPVNGNLNDHQVHEFTLDGNFNPGDIVAVQAKSWVYDGYGSMNKNKNWDPHMSVNGVSGSANAIALRNGDPVPAIAPFADQSGLETFIADYVDTASGVVSIGQNDIIYLFELGVTNPYSSAFDFQDLVLLLTLKSLAPQESCPAKATLLGYESDEYLSTPSLDFSHTVDGFENYTGYAQGAAPLDYLPKTLSLAMLDSNQYVTGFVTVRLDALRYVHTGDPAQDYLEFDAAVLAAPDAVKITSR